jgi:hypothetical protein
LGVRIGYSLLENPVQEEYTNLSSNCRKDVIPPIQSIAS